MAVIEEIDEQVQEMGGEEGKPEGDADEIGKVGTVGAGATVLEDIASPVFFTAACSRHARILFAPFRVLIGQVVTVEGFF